MNTPNPNGGPGRRTRRKTAVPVATSGELAEDVLSGTDTELRALARRLKRAQNLATRQTTLVRELRRRLAENEASRELKAENDRLRADVADLYLAVGAYARGDLKTGSKLAAIVAPHARRFAGHVLSNAEMAIDAAMEHAKAKKRFIYDSHGHRVRADLADENNECPECHRESVRK